ncbi:hypothetical protein [Neobacillus sp. NPDC093127]|uniref:hypothetical protein n=1 Tax=Neobacillus sp. NPDC093127 TaxID=3364296 RepID=UPI00381CCAF9
MFGQSEVKNSEPFYAIVSAHMFRDDNKNAEIEILDIVHTDYDHSEIFCDIEYMVRDALDFGDKEEHFFMASVKAWFHSYHDYFDGYQCEVESVITEIKSIDELKKIFLT